MQQPGVIIPIIGARTESQINDNLGSLDFELSDDHMQRLDEISKIDLGFPHEFLARDYIRDIVHAGRYSEIDNHRR
jgi:diketogulonate reductase-like aldo/keto reductase